MKKKRRRCPLRKTHGLWHCGPVTINFNTVLTTIVGLIACAILTAGFHWFSTVNDTLEKMQRHLDEVHTRVGAESTR